ncbi:hypothetical protein Axi01nite_34600 [Actinoplanes xinjiangensis]|nr:hypothetical protein Axi01nite_34600 [Actinoplanes xinjiangensis]
MSSYSRRGLDAAPDSVTTTIAPVNAAARRRRIRTSETLGGFPPVCGRFGTLVTAAEGQTPAVRFAGRRGERRSIENGDGPRDSGDSQPGSSGWFWPLSPGP